MGTCKDCKYWETRTYWFNGKTFHHCDRIEEAISAHDVRQDEAKVFVQVDDSWGLEWMMVTGAYFSCSMFEAKTDE